MNTGRPKSHTGDYNIKRRFGKGFRNSKKSMVIFSSHKKNEINDSNYEDNLNTTPHRSCSLSALHTDQILLQPRMAQLETLEAKMARIENSLSTTPRKKKISSSNGSITSALVTVNASLSKTNVTECNQSMFCDSKSNSLQTTITLPKISDCNNSNTLIYKTSKDIAREMETLKKALRDKENVIDKLKGQLNTSLNFSRLSSTYLQSKHKNDHAYRDKQAAEDRLQRLKHEMDNKSLLIKNIKLELERLDITDNIDVRIQQAELEYQLGREELNLLSILEEIQSLKILLEEKDSCNHQNENTLFNFVQNKQSATLHAIEIIYELKNPRFGVAITNNGNGMSVEWATEDSHLLKGDQLLEINGKITLGFKNRDDMIRLLSVSPNPAQIVVLRQRKNDTVVNTLQEELDAYREKAGEAERIRDSFRSDNVRLTHRISYLEEQVADLLARVSKGELTNVKLPVDELRSNEAQIQIFQKGSKVTLISNVSPNKNMLKIRDTVPTVQQETRYRNSCKSLDRLTTKDDLTQKIEPLALTHYSNKCDSTFPLNSECKDKQSNKSVSYPSPSSSYSKNKENLYDRRLKYIRDTQNGSLNCNSSDRIYKHFKDDRSTKSIDFDSEPNYQSLNHTTNGRIKMYDSETSSDYSKTMKYTRPIPPQKPLRLSLHKGCSLQSVKIIDKSSNDHNISKKFPKRSQKSESIANSNSLNNGDMNNHEKWC
ncbi:hypothetical protein PGB90_003878 [Kerria lacca]